MPLLIRRSLGLCPLLLVVLIGACQTSPAIINDAGTDTVRAAIDALDRRTADLCSFQSNCTRNSNSATRLYLRVSIHARNLST